MCTHCPGLRQNIHGPSDCIRLHGHTGDCSKTAFDDSEIDPMLAELQRLRAMREAERIPIKPPPAPPWFIPVIAELLPTQKTAREMPRPGGTYTATFIMSGVTITREFMRAIDKGEF